MINAFHRRCLPLLLCLSAVLGSSACARATAPSLSAGPTVESIIARVIEAHGGSQRLAAVRSIAAEGTIVRFLAGDTGTYRRVFQRDRKLLVDIVYPTSRERRILNGEQGYRGSSTSTKEVTGPPYLAMVYQYNQLDVPFGFIDGALTPLGFRTSTRGGSSFYVLSCRDPRGHVLDATIDAAHFTVAMTESYFQAGQGVTSLAAAPEDYRSVDGVLLPFKIVNYAGGQKISETRITGYQINTALEPGLFVP